MVERGEYKLCAMAAVVLMITAGLGLSSQAAIVAQDGAAAESEQPIPALANSATATGPVGEGPQAVTITYTWSGTPMYVTLSYTTNGGLSWNLAGSDMTVDGAFSFTCPTAGTYYWNAKADETDMVPAEAGPYVTPGVPPTVVSTVPANGATGVSLGQNIVITFSEPMNTATVIFGTSFTISPNPGGSWSFVWGGGNSVVTFSHSLLFSHNTYVCTVTTAVTDVAGNHMLSNYVWSFTTLAPAFTTATGPTSATPTKVTGVTITYTYASIPTSVNLYYTMNGGTTWTLAGNDVTVDGSYFYTITSGSGTYGWIAQAVGSGSIEPSPPAGGTMPEASPYVLDIAAPTIVSTVPANGATAVSPTENIVVTFSEAMKTSSLAYNITPNPGGLTVAWSGGNTILTIYHIDFQFFTFYTAMINCQDVAGNWLAGGYTWSWTTMPVDVPIPEAQGLSVSKSGGDNVVLSWTNPTAADFWDIYAGIDKTNVRQPGNLLATVVMGTGSYTHVGAQNDGNTWYYLVVGRSSSGSESANSTMGVKTAYTFTKNAAPRTNVMWLTLLQDAGYATASDIVLELEGGLFGPGLNKKINALGKWLPSYQYSTGFIYDSDFEEWTGDNFLINPGDAIYFSITSSFNWSACGTDTETALTFTHNAYPKTNVMWFNLPQTCAYQKASDIVLELEGALTGAGLDAKINVVGMWMSQYQAATALIYDDVFEEWTGDDFTIKPGCGFFISVTSSFTWTPALLTEAVP